MFLTQDINDVHYFHRHRHHHVNLTGSIVTILCLLLLVTPSITVYSYSSSPLSVSSPSSEPTRTKTNEININRRCFFMAPIVATATMANYQQSSCQALDMDAFINKELSDEKCNEKINKKCKPELSEDAALCRFGQPSKETGEACIRAGLPTNRPGGVDAFGKIDRNGGYAKCKAFWVDDGVSRTLVKEWRCEQ